MLARVTWAALTVCAVACGGSEFRSAGTGGSAGSAGAAPGGSGGTVASGGGSGGSAGVATDGSVSGGAPGGGGATAIPISVVQTSPLVVDSTTDQPKLVLAKAPSAGNAILVGISCYSTVDGCTLVPGSVSDDQGNVYARVEEGVSIGGGSDGVRGYLFIAENVVVTKSPFTISVNPNGTSSQNEQAVAVGAIEVSGLAPAPALDQHGKTPAPTQTTATSVSSPGPLLQPNELAVALLSLRSDESPFTINPDASWTPCHVSQGGQGAPLGHSLVAKVLSSTAIVTHTWTHKKPGVGSAAILATFRGQSPD